MGGEVEGVAALKEEAPEPAERLSQRSEKSVGAPQQAEEDFLQSARQRKPVIGKRRLTRDVLLGAEARGAGLHVTEGSGSTGALANLLLAPEGGAGLQQILSARVSSALLLTFPAASTRLLTCISLLQGVHSAEHCPPLLTALTASVMRFVRPLMAPVSSTVCLFTSKTTGWRAPRRVKPIAEESGWEVAKASTVVAGG